MKKASFVLDPRYADALAQGQVTEAQLDEMARSYNNVIREYVITLEAVKGQGAIQYPLEVSTRCQTDKWNK